MTERKTWRSAACKVCGKDFARSDTLLRHEKSHHATEDRGPLHRVTTGSFRACSACATAKVRCSGGFPCGRCNIRKIDCIYTNKRQKAAHHGHILGFEPQRSDGAGERFQNSVNSQAALSADVQTNVASQTPVPFRIAQENHVPAQSNQQYPVSALAANFGSGFEPSSYDYSAFEEPLNWIPISVYPSPYENEFEHDVSFLFPSLAEPTGLQIDYSRNVPLSLPDQPAGDSEIPHRGEERDIDIRPLQFSAFGQSPQSTASNDHLANKSNTSSAGTTESRRKRRKSSHIDDLFSRPRNRSNSYSFPNSPAFAVSEAHTSSRSYCSRENYQSICDAFDRLCISTALARPFENPSLPSQETLDTYIGSYFDYFHSSLPILHQPTFGKSTDWIVLLAAAAIGSNFEKTPGSTNLREAFQEFLRRAVNFYSDELPACSLDLHLAQARILSLIGLNMTDSEQLRSLVPRYHAEVSRWCLESGILQLSVTGEPADADAVGSELNREWSRWIYTESLRRVGYFSWLLDTSLGYLANCRPLCNLDDARTPLPCSESLWSATNSEGWRVVYQDSKPPPSLCEALEFLYEKKALPPLLSEIAQVLLINALFQRTWEVGTHIKQPLSEWVPTGKARGFLNTPSKDSFWLPLYPLYANWRNSACDCLDIINWQAASMVAKASGTEHNLILHLHLARIVLLTPFQEIQDLVFSLIGRVGTASSASFYVHDGSYQPRNLAKLPQIRKITWRWLREDQHKARLAMIHAGSVFWHVRRYSSQSFYEPLAVYLASMVLWTYGSYKSAALERDAANSNNKPVGGPSGPDADLSIVQPSRVERGVRKPTASRQDQDTPGHLPVQHDRPPLPVRSHSPAVSASPSSHADASSDTESESPPQFIHLDRPCDDEMVQHFVRNGHNMAGYMAGVGDICTTPNKVLLEGAKLLRTRLNCWGVSREYFDVLMAVYNR